MAKLALLGDSMIETGLEEVNLRTRNRWLSGPLVSILGPAFEQYYNHGVGGDTIEDCLVRVGNIEADAEYVLVECGINDLSRDYTTLDSMQDAYENIIRSLRVAGKKIICCTILERKKISQGGAVAEEQYPIRPQFNEWLRGLKANGAIDALADIGRNGNYRATEGADDGTHPNTNLCVGLAEEIAKAVLSVRTGAHELGPNLLAEPQLMGNAGTSSSAHISGDIATGWRFLDQQAGTEQILCETIMDGQGGSQRLTFSGAPSGSAASCFFRDNQSSVDIALGDTVMTSFRLKSEGVSGIIGVSAQLYLPFASGASYLSAMYVSPSDASIEYRQIEANGDNTFYSMPYTATEMLTGCLLRIAISYLDNAELSGSVTISEPQVRILS